MCARASVLSLFSLLCALLCIGQLAFANPVIAGKQATAMVIVEPDGGSGTAFCIDKSGFFLTSAHVVGNKKEVKLVMNAGDANQAIYTATVLKTADNDDLGKGINYDFALLKITPPAPLTALELGNSDAVVETSNIIAFGYPFGRMMTTDKDLKYPSISVSTGKITALRKSNGKLVALQMDATLNPGNSGGPVLDETGRVIGIVWSGVRGAGLNFAIPANMMQNFLFAPLIDCPAQSLALPDAIKTLDLPIRVHNPLMPDTKYTVELVLNPESPHQRVVTAELEQDGVYHARMAPISPRNMVFEGVRITLQSAKGALEVVVPDTTVTVGGKSYKLSTLVQIARIPKPQITLVTGDVISGAVTGLGMVNAELGGFPVQIDLSAADTIVVASPFASISSVPYLLRIKSPQMVTVLSGAIGITLPSTKPAGAASAVVPKGTPQAHTLGATQVVRELPGIVEDAVLGGGGRYLFLVMPKEQCIGVFDMTTCKLERTIPLPDSDVLVAASADTLFVVLRGQNMMLCYSMATWEKRPTARLPFEGVPMNIAAGWNSSRPFLIRWARGTDALDSCSYEFFDPNTLQKVPIPRVSIHAGISYRDRVHLRASGDGTLFGLWTTEQSPTGLEGLQFIGTEAKSTYEHTTVGQVVPSADGKWLLTKRGIYTAQCRLIGKALTFQETRCFIPSTSPSFYVGLSNMPQYYTANYNTPLPVQLYVMGNDTPLFTIDTLPPNFIDETGWKDLTLDKRIIFNEYAKLLVLIPPTNDRLILRYVNIEDGLQRMENDYLFISSVPVTVVRRGGLYEYQIRTLTNKTGLKYSLDGPAGMTVSATGLIRWTAPPTIAEKQVPVILTITDAAGQQKYQSFNISIEE